MSRTLGQIGLLLTCSLMVVATLLLGVRWLSGALDSYVVTDLGAFSNRSIAYSIRTAGRLEVVGSAGTYPEDETAFIYTGGSLKTLPMRQARGINSTGEIAGSTGL